MVDIPYGRIDLEAEGLRLYKDDECEHLFSGGYERFSRYQDTYMLDPPDLIMDGFEKTFASKYSEAEWQ